MRRFAYGKSLRPGVVASKLASPLRRRARSRTHLSGATARTAPPSAECRLFEATQVHSCGLAWLAFRSSEASPTLPAGTLVPLLVVAALLSPIAPARSAATGTITGRVLNETTNKPQSGVRVTVVSGGEEGVQPVRKSVVTDRGGRYRFQGLPTGEDRFYALDARYDGGLFSGRAFSIPSDTASPPVIESTLRVWDTTTDPSVVSLARDDVFLGLGENGVGVVESVIVVNATDHAYIGRGRTDARPGDAPSLGFALPDGAQGTGVAILDSDIDVPEIAPADFGFAVTVAIPPGRTQMTFTYTVRGTAGNYDVTRVALYPVGEYNVHATEPLDVSSNRLDASGEVTIGERRYRRWSAPMPIEAGDPIQVLAVARGEESAWLVAGIAAAILVIAGSVAFALGRRRKTPQPSRPARTPSTRDDLVGAIAELDLRYRAGEMSAEQWMQTRTGLKERLSELPTPERS
jgi:hypothetical protein